MYELSHELPNDLRRRMAGSKDIARTSLKNLELMASLQPVTQKKYQQLY